MTDEDLKQIRSVVKEEIDSSLIPIKKMQDQHTQILDKHTHILDQHTQILDQHTQILDQHTQILDQHTQILDKHTQKLEALWDQTVELSEDMTEVKITLKSNTVDLEHTKKRVTVVEDHLGL